MALLARRFGARVVLPTVATLEQVDERAYDDQPETTKTDMSAQERSHARVLRYIAGGSPQGIAGETLATLEGRHRVPGGNSLRVAVLGANDGLTSNLALVMGVAGAQLKTAAVLITGLSGLLAGSFSMAIGEWISVQSARELTSVRCAQRPPRSVRSQTRRKRNWLSSTRRRVSRPKRPSRLQTGSMADEKAALDAMVREKLGLYLAQLGGSPYAAGASSLLLFATGAIIPLIPYFITSGNTALVVSVCCAALGLFTIGTLITLLDGPQRRLFGTRQLCFGLLAAGATFGLGRLIGAAVNP